MDRMVSKRYLHHIRGLFFNIWVSSSGSSLTWSLCAGNHYNKEHIRGLSCRSVRYRSVMYVAHKITNSVLFMTQNLISSPSWHRDDFLIRNTQLDQIITERSCTPSSITSPPERLSAHQTTSVPAQSALGTPPVYMRADNWLVIWLTHASFWLSQWK